MESSPAVVATLPQPKIEFYPTVSPETRAKIEESVRKEFHKKFGTVLNATGSDSVFHTQLALADTVRTVTFPADARLTITPHRFLCEDEENVGGVLMVAAEEDYGIDEIPEFYRSAEFKELAKERVTLILTPAFREIRSDLAYELRDAAGLEDTKNFNFFRQNDAAAETVRDERFNAIGAKSAIKM